MVAKWGLPIYSEHYKSLNSNTFLIILVLYFSTFSLKGYNDNDVEVQQFTLALAIVCIAK